MNDLPAIVQSTIAGHPSPLLFATISGAHLYGFASADSDYDIRGAHILALDQILGLDRRSETIEQMLAGPPEVDLVTHDVEKFFRLLLRPNGYVLEQLYSPLVVSSSPEFEELKKVARGCLTRRHVRHYVGFAENQWRLFAKEQPPRVKPLLYTFRVLLAGIHLLKRHEVEANLVRLNESAGLSYIDELIARKRGGSEAERIETEMDFYRAEYERLMATLVEAGELSTLPELPTAHASLNDLLLRLRRVRS
jgi:predicted nucleotidyltransferase